MIPKAIRDTLTHLWKSLEGLDVPMALMGGMAMSAWDYVRATKDIDLLVGIQANEPLLLSALKKSGFRFRQTPPLQRPGEMHHARLVYDEPGEFIEIHVDLLFADSEYHRRALERRKTIRLPDVDLEICVLSCEDL